MYKKLNIAVVIPAYNEEASIGKVIDSMPNYVDKVIVVDDGSNDKTSEISKKKGAFVIKHRKNKGIGAAFRTGIKKVLELYTDIMVNIDADRQFNPEDIQKLIEPIINRQADFVIASRFKNPKYYPKMSRAKFIGNKFMSFLVSKISGQKFYDVSCGFRAYSREALLRLNLFEEFTYTHEALLDLAFKNVRIVEIPVEVKGTREYGKSKIASNLFKYGYNTLKIVLKIFRDYKPFKLLAGFSLLAFFVGFALAMFLLAHYINTSSLSPHKWAGFISVTFLIISLLILATGFILEMLARMRYNQEEILHALKKILDRNKSKKGKEKK